MSTPKQTPYRDKILNLNIPWKEVLDVNNTVVYRSKRVDDYINNCWDKSLNKELDLATLLILLRYRNCEITIPEYNRQTVKKTSETVDIVSNKTHGKIRALVSNQNTFSFSVQIDDKKYTEEKLSGKFDYAPRTYNITDSDGNFNDIWSNFTFEITDEEKEYLKNTIGVNGEIVCKKFVNPQVAQAMYTDYYYDIKILIERLVSERKYLSNIKKKYLPLCKKISVNEYELDSTKTVVKEDKKNFESVKVLCFETVATVPGDDYWKFAYINEKLSPEEIVKICDDYMDGLIGVTTDYKFISRLIDFAFTKMNPYKEDMTPADFQTYNNRFDCKWNPIKIKLPRSRIEWFELMFRQYSLLCRYYYKSIQKKIIKE